MSTLFIGGPADGRRLNTDGRDVVKVTMLPDKFGNPMLCLTASTAPEPLESYYRVTLYCFGTQGEEWVYTYRRQWTEARVLAFFIENYKK